MKATLYVVLLCLLSFSLAAQSVVVKKGKAVLLTTQSECDCGKGAFALEAYDGTYRLDFTKFFSLMDKRAYLQQYVVVTGIVKSKTESCKCIEVTDLHFDIGNPDMRKAVNHAVVTGFNIASPDRNPMNDFHVVSNDTEFNTKLAPVKGETGEMPDFQDQFVLVINKSDRSYWNFKDVEVYILDNALYVTYNSSSQVTDLSDVVPNSLVIALDRINYKQIIFKENGDVRKTSDRQYIAYKRPNNAEKKVDYTPLTGYRFRILPTQNGDQTYLVQTLKQFNQLFEEAPLKKGQKRVMPNFASEVLIIYYKAAPQYLEVNVQGVSKLQNSIIVRMTSVLAETAIESKNPIKTISTHGLIIKKGVFNKIEFEENTEKKGEIERFPEIPRLRLPENMPTKNE